MSLPPIASPAVRAIGRELGSGCGSIRSPTTRTGCGSEPGREVFDAHPSELRALRERSDVLLTGPSAADVVGLLGEASAVEFYAPAGRREAVVVEHALMAGQGAITVRWVPDEVWAELDGAERVAPRAAVLVDLLESEDPRARREAARALAP